MATLRNSITCVLEARNSGFHLLPFFSVGGYVTALTFLTLKFFPLSEDCCDNPPLPPLWSFDSTPLWGVQENAFTAVLPLCSPLRYPSLSSSFKPGNTTVCLTLERPVWWSGWWRPLICGALRVRSRLRLSPNWTLGRPL